MIKYLRMNGTFFSGTDISGIKANSSYANEDDKPAFKYFRASL